MFLLLSAALAAPAMVTASNGGVTLEGEDAPPAPYILNEGSALKLESGASIVVLYEGAATQVKGPATVRVGDLAGATVSDGDDALAALGDLMERTTSVASVGATRATGELTLTRPLSGSTVIQPAVIDWSCSDCGTQTVEIISFLDDEVVWTGSGEHHLVYDGPELSPGPYAVKVGAYEFSFKVAKSPEVATVEAAVGAAKAAVSNLDVASATSVISAVYLQADMPAEALRTVDEAIAANPDNAELKVQQHALEKRLGLVE